MRLTEFDTDKSTLNEAGPAVVAAPAGYAVFWALARSAGFASARAYAQHILRNPKTYSSVLNSAANAFAKVDGMLGNNTLYPVDKSTSSTAQTGPTTRGKAGAKALDKNAAAELKSAADAARAEADTETQAKVSDIMQSDAFTQAPVQPSFSTGDTVSYTSRRNKDGATAEFVKDLPNGMVQLQKDGATFAIDPINIDTSAPAALAPDVQLNVPDRINAPDVNQDMPADTTPNVTRGNDKTVSTAKAPALDAPVTGAPPTIVNVPPEAKPAQVGPTTRGKAGAKAGAGTATGAGTAAGAGTATGAGTTSIAGQDTIATTGAARITRGKKGKGKDKPDLPSRNNTDQSGAFNMMRFSPIEIKDPLSLKSTRSTYAPN